MKRVGLFIPCYINQLYPSVAIATLRLLERFDASVVYPIQQTCCGQPTANSGFEHLNGRCYRQFLQLFADFEYVVSPSGSCVLHIKEHLNVEGSEEECARLRGRIFELTEFLVAVIGVKSLGSYFPHKVGLHQSCHGQRGLRLSQMSELVEENFGKPEGLLAMVKGLELVSLSRKDECCGFGGSFCVTEDVVSAKMGEDRVTDHLRNGIDFITSCDMSCLMHLEGILRRKKSVVRVIHIAEILNAGGNAD